MILPLGKPIELITPHILYQGLAKTEKTRQKRYTALFDKMIPDYTLEEIRNSINRTWVLGDERFKQQIEKNGQTCLTSGKGKLLITPFSG